MIVLEVRFEENLCGQLESINRSITELLEHSKLRIPSSTPIHITLNTCHTWIEVVKEAKRCKLLGCDLPEKVFIELVSILISEEDNLSEGPRL